MKAFLPWVSVFAVVITGSTARAQFPNFPAADRVLGAPDFITPGFATATPTGMTNPAGLAIDPRTGKLYVSSNTQNRVMRFPNVDSLANGADAEAVLGQANFSGTGAGTTASILATPYGPYVDGKGRLWVVSAGSSRVLMYEGADSLANGAPADRVFGQPDFTTGTPATSSVKMSNPSAVFVDGADNLWVADFSNNRVLKFANVSTLGNGAAATVVLGQPNFTTLSPGTSQVTMSGPTSVAVDADGRLWVSEQSNHRVLRFDNAAGLANGAAADGVLGQALFTTGGLGTGAQGMGSPAGVVVDAAGTLYVSAYSNNRILVFKNAAAKADGAAADGVIGQPDFTTTTPGLSERKLGGVYIGMALDAAGRLWVSDSDNNRILRFSPDRTAAPPTVTSKSPKTTASASLALKGTAADPSGISQVRFRVGKAAFKTAAGTTSWSFKAKLKPGKNKIEIVAVDALGNVSAAKRVKVTRQ